MTYNNLSFHQENHVAVLVIERPEKLNALNAETIQELHDLFTMLQTTGETRALVLTGAGEKSFVAGADITELNGLDAKGGEKFASSGQAVFNLIEHSPFPVIAAVNGFALGGGCELAMACHIRLAAETARFGLPEINLGIIPGYGGTQRLPRLVGRSDALRMMLSGDMIDAAEAYRIGLVSAIFPADALVVEARKLAARLATRAPLAAGLILDAVRRGSDGRLQDGLDIEAANFGKACTTEDMKEGTGAFIEKRRPRFKGR